MENFNIKRFGHTFKWYFCENRQQLLYWTIGLALATLVIESFIIYTSIGQIPGYKLDKVNTLMLIPLCLLTGAFASAMAWSNIFSCLKVKQKRISFLTLPATTAERFLAALILSVVIWPLCILIAICLGDTLRMLLFGLFGKGWVSLLSVITSIEEEGITGQFQGLKIASQATSSLWLCSIFILGGTWLRKHPFIITGFALVVLFSVFTYIVVHYFNDNTFDNFDNQDYRIYCTIAIFLLLAIANFMGSYWLFKRFQLITSKWFNV